MRWKIMIMVFYWMKSNKTPRRKTSRENDNEKTAGKKGETTIYIQIGDDLRKIEKKKKTKKKYNNRNHHENEHDNQRKLKATGKEEDVYIHTCVYICIYTHTTIYMYIYRVAHK